MPLVKSGALRAMQQSLTDMKEGKVLKLSETPSIQKILITANKKGLLRG